MDGFLDISSAADGVDSLSQAGDEGAVAASTGKVGSAATSGSQSLETGLKSAGGEISESDGLSLCQSGNRGNDGELGELHLDDVVDGDDSSGVIGDIS